MVTRRRCSREQAPKHALLKTGIKVSLPPAEGRGVCAALGRHPISLSFTTTDGHMKMDSGCQGCPQPQCERNIRHTLSLQEVSAVGKAAKDRHLSSLPRLRVAASLDAQVLVIRITGK